jgi:hypothetical protein
MPADRAAASCTAVDLWQGMFRLTTCKWHRERRGNKNGYSYDSPRVCGRLTLHTPPALRAWPRRFGAERAKEGLLYNTPTSLTITRFLTLLFLLYEQLVQRSLLSHLRISGVHTISLVLGPPRTVDTFIFLSTFVFRPIHVLNTASPPLVSPNSK